MNMELEFQTLRFRMKIEKVKMGSFVNYAGYCILMRYHCWISIYSFRRERKGLVKSYQEDIKDNPGPATSQIIDNERISGAGTLVDGDHTVTSDIPPLPSVNQIFLDKTFGNTMIV